MAEAPLAIVIREAKNFASYKPVEQEMRKGLMSSVHSAGSIGSINRTLARVFRQQEADIKAFLYHWAHPLSS